ncbi:hypothetical protein STEG23_011436 [Scotinomys teguina]
MVRWPTGEADDKQQFEKPYRDAMLYGKMSIKILQPLRRYTTRKVSKEECPVVCITGKAEIGRHQGKITYNNMKNKTSSESSPPPTPRPENCNVDKAEVNDLKNSLMKMIEEALEGEKKNALKEIE